MQSNDLPNNREMVIFQVHQLDCALPAVQVTEIIRDGHVTQVHQAPEYVSGVINLRGDIVTIIDLVKRLELKEEEENHRNEIIVVPFRNENVGLLVDSIEDIVVADYDHIDQPPSNIKGIRGSYFTGIYKMEGRLAAILNVDRILTKNA
jgi:purine-binding chemotaxis protein CheW